MQQQPMFNGTSTMSHTPSTKCKVCKRVLKDPKSIERGMGPVCARKNGIDQAGDEQMKNDMTLNLDIAEHGIVCERSEKGACTNIPSLHRHHSPTGFEWGYGGSGPADLALNILALVLKRMGYSGPRTVKLWDKSKCFDLAWDLHQEFKWEFVAQMERQGDRIPLERVETWLRVRMTLDQLETEHTESS